MKFARIVNDTAVDVRTESPEGCFTPDIADQFAEVPDEVENGWSLKDGVWSAPAAPEPAPTPAPTEPPIPLIGPIGFQLLFTVDELIAVEVAAQTVPAVKVFWRLLNDPRTTEVDRNLPTVREWLFSLEALNILPVGRAREILHGTITK